MANDINVVRIIQYTGSPERIEEVLGRSLLDGTHVFSGLTIETFTYSHREPPAVIFPRGSDRHDEIDAPERVY